MTRYIAMSALAAMLVAGVAGARDKGEISVESMPPSVVKTVPQAGDTNVNPGVKGIRVTFSKDMMTERMWAFSQISKDTFPKRPKGQTIRYLPDKRTCVMPVELEPEKTYVIWINRGRFNSFRDTKNTPAVPYLLVFRTGKETSAAEKQARKAAMAWLALIDKGRYAKSWDNAAKHFRAAVKRDAWPGMVSAVRDPLGKVVSREFKSAEYRTSLPGAPDGEYVVIQYATVFQGKRSTVETITPMLDEDGKWRVSGYYIVPALK